jgi:hypothetical protein
MNSGISCYMIAIPYFWKQIMRYQLKKIFIMIQINKHM